MKKNECCKNCAHFGWEMVKDDVPTPFRNICLLKNKRKSEQGWCNYWRNKGAGTLYIKTERGYEKLCEADKL